MLNDDTGRKIEDIVSGNVVEGQSDHCTAIRNFLCRRFETSRVVKKEFESQSIIKKEQEQLIIGYCDDYDFWVRELPAPDSYLTRGGESKVYVRSDRLTVVKLNDGAR
jgi:Serine/Threonine/Tyrosine Kinase found in polyvalent proteins